jgi:hypothetical protein
MQIFYFYCKLRVGMLDASQSTNMLNFDSPLGMALEQNQTQQILEGFCRRYCDAND